MRTLFEIVEKAKRDYTDCNDIEKAIITAYWAGQSNMRGTITEKVVGVTKRYVPKSRYTKIEKWAVGRVLSEIGELHGRMDFGRGEGAELLSAEFLI